MEPTQFAVDGSPASLLRAIGHGVCAPTDFGASDCVVGHSGAWRLASLEACARACGQCERCNFLSFSSTAQDCSWYQACEEHGLLVEGMENVISTQRLLTYTSYAYRTPMDKRRAGFVQPNFHDIDEYCGSRQAGISAHPEQVDDYANYTWEFARRHPRLREVRVCEVGLWCGHSAMTFLEQDPRVTLTSFSLNDTRQARDARTYLSSRYGNRVTFVLGDSATSLPSYMDSREGKGLRCDIAVVNGRVSHRAQQMRALMHCPCLRAPACSRSDALNGAAGGWAPPLCCRFEGRSAPAQGGALWRSDDHG